MRVQLDTRDELEATSRLVSYARYKHRSVDTNQLILAHAWLMVGAIHA